MMSEVRTMIGNIMHSSANTKDKTRLLLRVALFLPYQVALQRAFQKHGLSKLLALNPRYYYRFALPFLSSGLRCQEKLSYMCQHAQSLQMFQEPLGIVQSPQLLCDFSVAGQDMYFKMGCFEQFEKEGDVTFYLEDAQSGALIYALTGVFAEDGFMIGGVQGMQGVQIMRTLTKQMHGMRPHNLLFFCVTECCRSLGYAKVLGICNHAHIYKQQRKTEARIQFDYDAFWSDVSDGQMQGDWCVMPCRYPLKPLEDVKTKKRGMYRKRYVMLEQVAEHIHEHTKALLV